MPSRSLDKLHDERVDVLVKRLFDDENADLNDLFVSERVAETLGGDKFFFNGYELNKILAVMPFSPVVYVTVCPFCVSKEEFSAFGKLVSSGIVIPVLTGRYDSYSDPIRDLLVGHDHVSMYEYQAYRFFSVMSASAEALCPHCAGLRFRRMRSSVRRIKAAPLYDSQIERLKDNINPCVYPDFSLIDLAVDACRARDYDKLNQLTDLSEIIHELRDARAFNSAMVVAEADIAQIPEGISKETDEALQMVGNVRSMAARGLGLKFPSGVSIDRYIELAKDYQPDIAKVVADVELQGVAAGSGIEALSRRMSELNREIERIQDLKRYALLEASVALVKQHKAIITTALIVGAFGVAGSLAGCAGTIAGSASLKFAGRKGLIKESETINRLGRMIARDFQPHLDKLIAKYVGAPLPAVKVLSLRKKMEQKKAA